MNLYHVTVTFELRTSTTSSEGTLSVRRYANSAGQAISVVSSLFSSLSNYTWNTGANEGKKLLEVTNVEAEELNQ